MENKTTGFKLKKFGFPTKHYCQTLDLKDDRSLIEEYVFWHSRAAHWPEIRDGIRSVGILEMEIFLFETRLFMIVQTPLDFEWETAFQQLAILPRQAEWEEFMSVFQRTDSCAGSSEKWQLMDRIFNLYE